MHQIGEPLFYLIGRQFAAQRREKEPEEIERSELGGKGLGRSHSDLGPRMGIDHSVSLAARRRTDDIADRDDGGAALLCLAHGRERVGSLAGLGDGDEQVILAHQRAAVPELGGDIDLGRDGSELLEHILADQPRMP